ncbi:MAG: hypothetical protein V3V13_00280 [Paracoccaceae bacterium]
MVIDFKVITDPEEKWDFGTSDIFESASGKDIAEVTDCGNPDHLLRLLGTGITELPNVNTTYDKV